jgi:hypothetical protein
MTFIERALTGGRPDSIEDDVLLPRRQDYHHSPVDWRDEVLYFLLVDRFSDGLEKDRKLLDRSKLKAARPDIKGQPWSWQLWAESGGARWQGGSLKGILYPSSKITNKVWPFYRYLGHLTIE